MNIHEVVTEAHEFCQALTPEDRGSMLAIVGMDKDTVRTLLEEATKSGNADAIRFMRVAWCLHAILAALRSLQLTE